MKTKPVSASEKLNFSARNGWSEGEYQYQEAEVAARQTRLTIVRAEVKIWDQGTREGFAWEDAKLDSFDSFSRPNSRIKVHPDKNNKAWKLGCEQNVVIFFGAGKHSMQKKSACSLLTPENQKGRKNPARE